MADRVLARAPRARPRPQRGRHRPAPRLDRGQPPLPAPGDERRRRHADLPLRPPGHGAADRPDRAGRRGRRRPERRRHDPRRRRQVRDRGHGRGRTAPARPAGRAHAGVELLFTTKEEVGLHGAMAFDHSRLARARRLRLRHGGADRRGDHRARRARARSSSGSSAARRTRAWRPRRAAPRSRPRRGRSPTSASAAWTRRAPRTSASSAAERPATSSPTAASSRPRPARTTRRKLADLIQEMLETSAFAASLAGCTLESEVRESYRAYRFRADDEPVRIAARRARSARATRRGSPSPAAAPTRTRSTRSGSAASTSPTAWPRSTRPTSTSPSPTSRRMVDVTLGLVEAARDAA